MLLLVSCHSTLVFFPFASYSLFFSLPTYAHFLPVAFTSIHFFIILRATYHFLPDPFPLLFPLLGTLMMFVTLGRHSTLSSSFVCERAQGYLFVIFIFLVVLQKQSNMFSNPNEAKEKTKQTCTLLLLVCFLLLCLLGLE